MSGIQGLRGTGDWGTDERPKDFREGILRFNPNGTAPIYALSSRAGKRKTTDPEFAWWAEGNVIIRLQVNGALASGDTLISVDTADPTASTLSANLGTATNLKPGDILLCEPAVDSATFNQELIEVDTVMSDTQFTARRGAGGTTAASIADNIWLTVIGSAYAEGTGVPRAVTRNPIKFKNFIQIFKDTYELTGTADKTKTRTNNNFSEDKKRKMYKHSEDIEFSIMFGRQAETVGDNGKPKRFMGGLREFIPTANVTVFAGPVTPAPSGGPTVTPKRDPPAGPMACPWLGVKPFQRGTLRAMPAPACQWMGTPRSWQVAQSGSHQVSLKCLRPLRTMLGSATMRMPRWPFLTARRVSSAAASTPLKYGMIASGM